MLGLPIYLRGQTYYLHTRYCGKQVKKSLGTRDRLLAVGRAHQILKDIRNGMDLSKIRRYEINLQTGLLKSEGEDDHRRLLEAPAQLQGSGQGSGLVAPPALKDSFSDKQAGLRLLKLLEKYFLLKTHLKEATVLSYKTTIEELSAFLKNPLVQRIDLSDISRFQEHLAKNGNASRTIDAKIGTVRALMNFAIKQGYYFETNPAAGRNVLTKKQKESKGYGFFDTEEIRAIYKSEFLQTAKKSDPDYYWTLVLTLFTGCRISEITGLNTSQFKVSEKGTNFIRVLDSKTPAGMRDIPLPSELFEHGLTDFLRGKIKAFKYKMRLGKGSGNAVGKKFKRHIEELKLSGTKLVFHSLRKFLNDFFMRNGVEFEPRCQFLGHEINSVNVQIYTLDYTVDELMIKVTPPHIIFLLWIGFIKPNI